MTWHALGQNFECIGCVTWRFCMTQNCNFWRFLFTKNCKKWHTNVQVLLYENAKLEYTRARKGYNTGGYTPQVVPCHVVLISVYPIMRTAILLAVVKGVLCSLSHGSPLFGAPLHNNAMSDIDDCLCIMSMPHCVSSAARDIEHGREGGHFALQKRPHNLVAPNAVAYMTTRQKGMACTPRDPKCGRFFFIFLDFGQIPPPRPFLASRGQPRGGGGTTHPAAARNTPSI